MTTSKTATQGDDRSDGIKQDVANQLANRLEALEALIKQHPFAAAGIALGVGYLVARILHR